MIVIDTSVIFKWFDKNEEGRNAATAILQEHLLKKQEIIVPTILFDEITNAWATKSNLPMSKLQRNFNLLEKYSLSVVTPTFPLRMKIAVFARKYHVSAYDSTYAIIALENKCNLITADNKFVNKIKLPFVKLL